MNGMIKAIDQDYYCVKVLKAIVEKLCQWYVNAM